MTAVLEALDELSTLTQWVLWKMAPPLPGKTKPRKIPMDAQTGQPASATDPGTWVTMDAALTAYAQHRDTLAGVGYVFTADDPYVGIDLDSCRDPESGELAAWARGIVEALDSYTEISPSGAGVHIFVRAHLPPGGRKRGKVEMYDAGRYFTVTATPLPGTSPTIADRQTEIEAVHAEWFGKPPATLPGKAQPPRDDSDAALLRQMFASRNGGRIEALWHGDTSAHQSDQSSADLALCDHLAYWTGGDAGRVDGLFRQSALMRPKWDERHRADGATYGELTVAKAVSGAGFSRNGRPRNGVSPAAEPAPAAVPAASRWPAPADELVYHGLAGEFVHLIDPHTEADPVALLLQFLVAYGNIIGRSAHFVAEADKHYTNLYGCLVGETAKGRKGSSLGQVRRVFATVSPTWALERVQEGQSSGEGLIWAVRDAIEKRMPVMEGKRATGRYTDQIVDTGVTDKRLLAAESEFASLLRVLEREGNTLSAVLRQAWDTGTLRALTKNSPAKATGAHISQIGHITADELHRYLTRTEVANGLGNRFLWVCVRRSKVLPDGGAVESVDFGPLCRELEHALDFGATAGQMARDGPARDRWHEVYPALSEGKPGMAGALLARGEAQVMRLAMVYALLDLSPRIELPHLEAALALWRYCEASVYAVFGESVGDPVADSIMAALRDAPDGLKRSDVTRLFHGNRDADDLSRALLSLQARNLIVLEKVSTGGRAAEVIRLG